MRKFLISFLLFSLAALVIIGAAGVYKFSRVEGRYFDSDGVKIHYTVEGTGEPVVLVHGFAVNADLNWRQQGVNEALKQHFKVIAMDSRGHGLSGKPHDQGAYGEQMAHDVVNLMKHLEIERAHLVGYSLGGFISLKSAVLYPDRWKSITLMGSAWETEGQGRAIGALKMVEDAFRKGMPLGPAMEHFEGKQHPGIIAELLVTLSPLLNDEEALATLIRSIDDLMITKKQLQKIDVPMNGIVGTEDPFFESAEKMKALVPDYHFTPVPGGDHLSTPRQPEAKEGLIRFLKAHSGD